jgi:hypothetical protein
VEEEGVMGDGREGGREGSLPANIVPAARWARADVKVLRC